MTETLHTAPVRVGEQTIDVEHDLQMQLLDSLTMALDKGGDFSAIKYVLEQFIEFSDMHFLSEQLVMRLHGYPAYETHLEEHTRLMKKVREIREIVFRGEKLPSLQLVRELRDWLLTHIATEDAAFGEYLRKKEGHSA
jgi:hemerythrin-like metal-binding protein